MGKKKYIIELEDNQTAYAPTIIDGISYIKLLQTLPYTEPDIEAIRCEAYEDGRKSLLTEVQKTGTIKVGNEVVDDKGDTGVCTEISYPANSMHILYGDGTATDISLTGITKTGNDFPEVVDLLKKMRGETNSKPKLKTKVKRPSKQIPGQMSLF